MGTSVGSGDEAGGAVDLGAGGGSAAPGAGGGSAGLGAGGAGSGPHGRVGLVVVSHSRPLAEAAAALALQMVTDDPPPLAVAAGTADGGLGTDATAVAAALAEVAAAAPGGVLVLMDLGSAVLSAELALELVGDLPVPVRLSPAPVVEGLVAAVVQAATGGSLAEVTAEAAAGSSGKAEQLAPQGGPGSAAPAAGPAAKAGAVGSGTAGSGAAGSPAGTAGADAHTVEVELINPHGLHVRPAAAFVAEAARHDADVRVANLATGSSPVSGRSLTAVGGLGADQGHRLRLSASGPAAAAALVSLASLVESGFGEVAEPAAASLDPLDAPSAPVDSAASTVRVDIATAPVGGGERGAGGVGGSPVAVPTVPGEVAALPASPGIGIGPLRLLADPLADLATDPPDPAADSPGELAAEPPADLPGELAAEPRVDLSADPSPDPLADSPAALAADPSRERERLRAALAAVGQEVEEAAQRATAVGADPAIFTAHGLLLADEGLLAVVDDEIAAGRSADEAWRSAVLAAAAQFDALPGEYQRARAADIRSLGGQVLRRLRGLERQSPSQPGVVVAADLGPDEISGLDPDVVRAVVLAGGSPTSHAAILARSLGIPLVTGAGLGVLRLPAELTVIVDGGTGRVVLDPEERVLADYRATAEARRAADGEALARALAPAVTADGVRVHVAANVRSADDTRLAAEGGAEGVGLLRTEFLFLDRATAPTEDEQVQAYAAVARAAEGQRIVIRTLDVGGDKPLPYVPQPTEANPFLGLRGLRLALARPELFATQLRAIVRVAAEHPIGVMFPMVTTVAEVEAARAALDAACTAVGLDGLPPGTELGIMVEVPAAALRARSLAPHVDFFSIGTNDLVQYTLAAERGNPAVAHLGDGLDPAVLRLIGEVCRAAAGETRVAVCGELAADPVATAVLVGLGVRELSVGGRAVAAIKEAVRGCSARAGAELVGELGRLPTAADVRGVLAARG